MKNVIKLVISKWLRFSFYYPLWHYCNGWSKERIAETIMDFKAGTGLPILLIAPLLIFSLIFAPSKVLLIVQLILWGTLSLLLAVLYLLYRSWWNEQLLKVCAWLVESGGKTTDSELKMRSIVVIQGFFAFGLFMLSFILHLRGG